jgi:hypothetical protein
MHMATYEIVELKNTAGPGFSIDALKAARSMERVFRVDGLEMNPSGGFVRVALHVEPGWADRIVSTAFGYMRESIERVR